MSDLWIRQGVGHYTEATDADLAKRGYVKVWEDCPTCQGDPHKIDRWTCPDCGGSGKVPAEGVQQAANGWWIAPHRLERR